MKKHKRIPPVGAVMTPFPYYVDAGETVARVEFLMQKHNIRHIPVQQDGKVVGLVSERDLHRRATCSSTKENDIQIQSRDIMVPNPYVVNFDTPLSEVTAEMARRHIGSAIIVHHGKLAGILSAMDVCRILAEMLEREVSPAGGDDAA